MFILCPERTFPLGMKPPEAYYIETGNKIDDPCGNAGDGIDVLHPVVPTEKAEKQREHVDHNISQNGWP